MPTQYRIKLIIIFSLIPLMVISIWRMVEIYKPNLTVKTTPENALVKVLDIDQEYKQGMALDPGKHQLEVIAVGYSSLKQIVELKAGEDKTIEVSLIKEPTLTVKTNPPNARIELKNSEQEFQQGMVLAPGEYRLAVSAERHCSEEKTVQLKPGEDRTIEISLIKQPILTVKTNPPKKRWRFRTLI